MKFIRRILAALALAALGSPAAHASKYSDLWFNPQESGWGMNVVQQLDTAFITLFVYDANGKPAWYVAPAARITAVASTGPIFSGTLYRTEGPWYGGAFDPTKVKVDVAGDISLELLGLNHMRVFYSADGVNNVVREVVRQTWDVPIVASNYLTQHILRLALPNGAFVGRSEYQSETLIAIDNGQFFMRTHDQLNRICEYRGPHTQTGKLAGATGTFTCTAGDLGSGTFEVSELELTENGITGRLRAVAPNITGAGNFGGARF